MRWAWDPNKNRRNQRVHGLSFETAVLVFDDPLALSRADHHAREERWQTVGIIGEVAVLVVHTWPEPDPATGTRLGGSSVRERQRSMKGKPTKKGNSKSELEALAAMADEQIDVGDVPEVLDWSGAQRGLFYRPVKQQLTLRLDADVVAWFKRHAPGGRGYQTYINRALREYVLRHAMRGER